MTTEDIAQIGALCTHIGTLASGHYWCRDDATKSFLERKICALLSELQFALPTELSETTANGDTLK